jgi:CRISPR-associated protein Csm3
MYSKIKISAVLEVKTGLHIGGSDAFSAIGAVDSPVIRDSMTGQPIIPGSSLKGKMRVILSRSIENKLIQSEPNNDPQIVQRLFGTSEKPIKYSRLQFFDAFLMNADELKEIGATEVKFENTISRSTSAANPRQIERVIRGAKFAFKLTYDANEENEIEEDFSNIAQAISLLQADYLGGHGTRGYGRVAFYDFNVECVSGKIKSETLTVIKEKLKQAEYSA